MAYKKLGTILREAGLITEEQLNTVLEANKGTNIRLGEALIQRGLLTENQLMKALEKQLGIEYIDLSRTAIPVELANLFSQKIAKKNGVVPVRLEGNNLYLAMSDPLNFLAVQEVRAASRKKIVPMIASEKAVNRAISILYGNVGAARAIEDMKREVLTVKEPVAVYSRTNQESNSYSAPTVRLVNSIIARAVSERASDIHLEPREDQLCVRMRIDGIMRNILTVPKDLEPSVISRIKVMGGINITEHKIPQDGRADVEVHGDDLDLRISTLPTIHGEKLVIRLLDKNSIPIDKTILGLSGSGLEKYNELIRSQSGVIIIAGPTGSGKSSTMYAMINELNTEQVNLITLEDPVEYDIEGINQIQINEKTGMTFSIGLRAALRQDPDILAIGEVRDGETASIAMRAAITGHLVLTTIHTNSVASTIDRLLDIGVEPYLIAGALRGIISQRLVRRICPFCKQGYSPTKEEMDVLGINSEEEHIFYRGTGCPECLHLGYRGRIGVFEIAIVNHQLRRSIVNGMNREEIIKVLKEGSFIPIAENCRKLVLDGMTTVDEAQRVISSASL